MPSSKPCTKCGETKPLNDYYKQATCKDGYRPDCKDCRRAAISANRAAKAETYRQYDRDRYASDPVRQAAVKARARAHYEDNLEDHLEYKRAYYEANREAWYKYRAARAARLTGVEHQPYTRREIYDRDRGICRECLKELPLEPHGFHIDHIVPLFLGGPDTPANVQVMCPSCNRKKWMNLVGQIHLPV